MQKDERDLLEVLKFELNFLERGGYGRSTREPWRPVLIFEDSPTCMNYDCKNDPAPCSDCVLMQLVPPELRFGKIPCRQIPLNTAGKLSIRCIDGMTNMTLKKHSETGSWPRSPNWRAGGKRHVLRAADNCQPASKPRKESLYIRTFIRNVRIRHAQLHFIGSKAASSSASVPATLL